MATGSPTTDFGIDTLTHFCVMDTLKKISFNFDFNEQIVVLWSGVASVGQV